MGTATLFEETIKTSDGQNFHISAWCDLSDFKYPEFAWVGITATPIGSQNPSYRIHVCLADYTEKWMKRLVRAFCYLPEYRVQFAVDDLHHRNKHDSTPLILDGSEVAVDTRLVSAIKKLNDLGAKTNYCCQGGDGALAYISLQPGSEFPMELMQAWNGAGFDLYQNIVHAAAQAGLEDLAADLFCKSLDDWLAGSLDISGMRYQVTSNRSNTLPYVPDVKSTDSEVNKGVKKLLNLGKKARFRDYAALRSGRDKFSSVKMSELLTMLDSTAEAVIATGLPIEDQAKVARWCLRGLPVDIAVHKVKVDKEISENAHHRK